MKNFIKSPVVLGLVFVVCAVLLPYIYTFWGHPLSSKSQDWANFGTYISGILTPLAGLTIFWQILKQRKEAKEESVINSIQKNKLLIERHINLYDQLIENRTIDGLTPGHIAIRKTSRVKTLDNLKNGLVEPSEFSDVIPSKSTSSEPLIFRHLMLIAGNLDELSKNIRKTKDFTIGREAYFEYQVLCTALSSHGWLDESFKIYNGDIWQKQ